MRKIPAGPKLPKGIRTFIKPQGKTWQHPKGSYSVHFSIFNQTFTLEFHWDKEEAKWYAGQLRKALHHLHTLKLVKK